MESSNASPSRLCLFSQPDSRGPVSRNCTLQALLALLPIRQNHVQQAEKRSAVVRSDDMAEFMCDYIIDCVNWCLNQAKVQQKPT